MASTPEGAASAAHERSGQSVKRPRRPLTGAQYRALATKETDVQSAIVTHLRLHKWLVLVTDAALTVIDGQARKSDLEAGTPDVVASRCRDGFTKLFSVLLIEVKRPRNSRLRGSQKLWHEYARKFNIEVHTFYTVESYLQFYGEEFPEG